MTRTTVFGWYDDMVFGALERIAPDNAGPRAGSVRERLWRIVARRAILASGAEEQPLVFPGNDRPGIMTAEAALAYARRYGVAIGRKVAVFAKLERRSPRRHCAARGWRQCDGAGRFKARKRRDRSGTSGRFRAELLRERRDDPRCAPSRCAGREAKRRSTPTR